MPLNLSFLRVIMAKNYAESHLSQKIALVLKKISALKEKYPLKKKSSKEKPTVEHTHASMLVTLIEELLLKIQNDFVPYFDEQKTPSNTRFIYMMAQAKLMKNKLLGDPETLKIHHPMTFELADFLIPLINEAPQLNQLIPFFNPDSLSIDLSSINSIIVKNKKNEDASPSYLYEYTPKSKESSDTILIDGEEYYNNYRQHYIQLFKTEFANYFSNHAETQHAQDELARTRPLYEHLETTSTMINTKMDEFNKNHTKVLKDAHLADTIKALTKAITQHFSLITNNNVLKADLSLTLQKFHETLQERNIERPNYAVLDCKDKLSDLVNEQIATLFFAKVKAEDNLRKLLLTLCDKNCQIQLTEIDKLQTQLDDLNKDLNINDIVALEEAIKNLPEKMSAMDAIKQTLNEDVLTAIQTFLSDPKLSLLNDSGSIQEEMFLIYQPVFTHGNLLLQKINDAQNTEKSRLQAHLENAQYKANLSNANPQKLLEMLEKTEKKREEVQGKLAEIRARLQQDQNEISAIHEQLTALTENAHQTRKELELHNRDKSEIIQEAQRLTASHFPDHLLLDENELNEHETLFKLIQDQIIDLKILQENLTIPTSLKEVITILNSNEKPKPTFSKIKELPKDKNGIPLLFALINKKSLTNEFESRKKEFISSEQDISDFLKNLYGEVNTKLIQIDSINENINETLTLLDDKKKNCISNSDKHNELIVELQKFGAPIEELQNELQLLEQEETKQTININVLTEIIDLIPKIDHFRTQIELFAKEENLYAPSETISLRNMQGAMVEQLNNFAGDKNVVQALITANDKKFHQAIDDKLKSGIELVKDLVTKFEHQAEKAKAIGNNKSKRLQESNKALLAEIRKNLSELPNVEQLTALAQNIDEWSFEDENKGKVLETLKAARKNAEDQLTEAERANNAIGECIKERLAVTESLSLSLDTYLQERARKYKPKDFFISKDKTARADFITALNTDLKNYQESGDNSELLQSIREGMSRFPGIHLKTLLNQCLVAVNDMDRKIVSPVTIDFDFDAYHQATKASLDPNSAYFAKITDLYKQVEKMAKYGTELQKKKDTCAPIVEKLARELRYDIDHFVTTHPDGLSGDTNYSQFRENFTARLHSQDAAMSVHHNVWKPLLANVLAAAITLGIALGIKLIYSKISSGRCSFFMENTAHLNFIEKMEQSIPPLA
ncbi:MAG: hypothetical protein Q8M03_02985 [Legionella sp.]|nr:hypothetical protein [Legionella sp.]